MFGLALASGNVVSGEGMVLDAVRKRKVKLVILATDVSENTRKRIEDKCTYYKIPVKSYLTKEELGHSIGKEYRAVIGILDAGFSRSILKKIEEEVNIL
jgi:ribosomal protein L7Ae-like RNA K-turn-binding protein